MIPILEEPEIAWISFLDEIGFVMTRGEEMFAEEIKDGKIDNFFLPCYEEYFDDKKILELTNSKLREDQKQDLLTLIKDYRKKQHIILDGARIHLRFLEEQRSKDDDKYKENQHIILNIINYEKNKKSSVGTQSTAGGKV